MTGYKQQFFDQLQGHFDEVFESLDPLQKTIRQRIWDRFIEIGLAGKNDPGYQYFPFSQFYQESYELGDLSHIPDGKNEDLIYPECRRSHIVFVNGHYSSQYSDTSALPPEVVILPIKDALNTYGNFFQSRLARILKEETDPFALLNIAFSLTGLFFYVPPKVQIDFPIQCIYFLTNDRPILSSPRIRFILGREAKATWMYEYHCVKDFEYFSNGTIDVALEEGAIFEQFGILNPTSPGWCFDATRVTQKRDSQYKSTTCSTGSKSIRQDFRIALAGENASCDLKGICLLSENRQSHLNIHIEHQAPNCHSNQHFKNILSASSRASFEGKIYVHPNAQKTEAYQLNNNLLLSDTAIANSKPNLEIFADDVKASHGATVTQMNENHLHYLKTRGIGSEGSKKLLLRSFCRDILSQVSLSVVGEKMDELAVRHLS